MNTSELKRRRPQPGSTAEPKAVHFETSAPAMNTPVGSVMLACRKTVSISSLGGTPTNQAREWYVLVSTSTESGVGCPVGGQTSRHVCGGRRSRYHGMYAAHRRAYVLCNGDTAARTLHQSSDSGHSPTTDHHFWQTRRQAKTVRPSAKSTSISTSLWMQNHFTWWSSE